MQYSVRLFSVFTMGMAVCLGAALSARAADLPPQMHVQEHGGIDRTGFPVTGAIPLPRNALGYKDLDRLALQNIESGDAGPLQAVATGRWPDGSVKWLLLDFPVTVEADGQASFNLVRADVPPHRTQPLARQASGGIIVDTGAIVARFVGNKLEIRESGENGSVLVKDLISHIEVQSRRGQKQSFELTMANPTIKIAGPQRTVVKVEGWHKSANGRARYSPSVIRFAFYRDSAIVRIFHTFVISGDPNEVLLGDVSLRVALAQPMTQAALQSSEGAKTVALKDRPIAVFQENTYEPKYPDHYHNKEFQGRYVARYEARSPAQVITDGEEYGGALTLAGADSSLSVFIKDFWQLSPKALAYDPQEGQLYLGLYPGKFAGALDLMRTELRDPPHYKAYKQAETGSWGKFTPTYVQHDLVHSAMGMSRTHEIVLHFDETATAPADPMQVADLFGSVCVPFVSGEWNVQTGAIGEQVVPGRYPEFDAITTAMTDTVAKAIAEGGWYGLMTYGNVHYGWNKERGSWMKYSPKWGWYHAGHMMNGGTMPQALWHQYLRTGRPDYYELAEARSQQVEDLSVVHYHDDPKVVGSMLRHGGPDPWIGHRSDHGGHHPLGGIPLHYYVTGYERAADVTHLLGQENYEHKDFNHGRAMDTDMGNMLLYYQFTGDKKYLERAKEYLDHYYRTRDEARTALNYVNYFSTALRWFYDATDDRAVREKILAAYLPRYHYNVEQRGVGNPEMAAFAWQLQPTAQHKQWLEEALNDFRRDGSGQIGWYDNMLLASPNEFMLATAAHYGLRQWQKATKDQADPPNITPDGGTFAQSVPVNLDTPQPDARIVYTKDGSIPDPSSPIYDSPVVLGDDCEFHARSLAEGVEPSGVTSARFTVEPAPFAREGLELWLRADRGVDVDQDGRVTAWSDQSGQGRHALPLSQWSEPPFFTASAINGHPAVRAEGKQSLQLKRVLPLKGDCTFVILAGFGGGGGEGEGYSGAIVGDEDDGHIAISDMPNGRVNIQFSATGGSASVGLQQPYQPGTVAILTVIRESDRVRVYRDGQSQTGPHGTAARTETFNLAALLTRRSYGVGGFSGQLAEMLIFSRALPDDERLALERAFAQRYALKPGNQQVIGSAPTNRRATREETAGGERENPTRAEREGRERSTTERQAQPER